MRESVQMDCLETPLRAERNVTLRGLNHSGSTNTSPSVTGCHLLSSLPHSVCEPTSSKKREKTTHQPGEGAIWGMWKVAIATKRRDKEIKAQNKPIIPLDKPKLQELAVPKPISLKSQSKSNLSFNKKIKQNCHSVWYQTFISWYARLKRSTGVSHLAWPQFRWIHLLCQ